MVGKRPRNLPAFKWTAAKDEYFLNLVIDYQLTNGRGQPMKWPALTPTFDGAMKVKCNEDTLKNRYQLLKARYKDWTDLKYGETGLGWDSTKGTIEADEEWWDKKIEENKEYKIFRTRGIPPTMEALMAAVFGGTVATGDYCVVPGQKTPVQNSVFPEQAHSVDSFEATADLDGDMNEVPAAEDQAPEGYMASVARDAMFTELDPGTFSCPRQIPSTSRQRKKKGQAHTDGGVGGKRNIRQSQGSSLYQQHLKCSIEANQAMMSLWQAEATSANQASHQPVDRNAEAVTIVDEMVAEGLFSDDDPLWAFAVYECQKESFVTTFLNVKNNVKRLRFLRYAYNKSI